MTATEASRAFAAVLDEAEQGHTVIVTRGGRRIATIGPASAGNGAEVRDLLSGAAVDDEFAADVRRAQESVSRDEPAWRDD
jgi:prevent-host-death family protein